MGATCAIYSVTAADVPSPVTPPSGTADLLRYQDEMSEMLAALDEQPCISLDKAWDLLHFSLGNHEGDHPLAFIETGGETVPALEDGIASSGRYFSPAEVATIQRAVAAISDAELARNFARRDEVSDPSSLYPAGLAPFAVADVYREVRPLRDFLAGVVGQKRGIIVLITA